MVRASKRKKERVYCGSEGPLTVEHVVPISRWQEYRVKRRVLDNKSNRVVACARCNGEKGEMGPKECVVVPQNWTTMKVQVQSVQERGITHDQATNVFT